MTRKSTTGVGLFTIGLLVLTLFLTSPAKGSSDDCKALIVVSSCNGTDDYELTKAIAFYDYLIENGYDMDDITFLTDEKFAPKDGNASISEITGAFNTLVYDSKHKTEVCIYISDNSHANDGATFYEFDDGNISCDSIIEWIDDMKFDDLNYITLGNHSGLFGPQLLGPDRVIMSSMREYEETLIDHFNIARSLDDPTADSDLNGKITFIEAFFKEQERLEEYWDQNPEIWI